MSDNRAALNAKLTRVDKAAILLLSLGETDAAQVLRHMGPKKFSAWVWRWRKCATSIVSRLSR